MHTMLSKYNIKKFTHGPFQSTLVPTQPPKATTVLFCTDKSDLSVLELCVNRITQHVLFWNYYVLEIYLGGWVC